MRFLLPIAGFGIGLALLGASLTQFSNYADPQLANAQSTSSLPNSDETFCLSNQYQLSEPITNNSDGRQLLSNSIPVGSQVVVQGSAMSNCNIKNYPILMLLEVRNDTGIDQYFAYQNISLNYGDKITAGFSWFAIHSGTYKIRMSVHSCLRCSGDYGITRFLNFTVTDTLQKPSSKSNQIATVVIPANASSDVYNSGYTPSTITVVLGINNTVTWINHDIVPVLVSADNYTDAEFWNATGNNPAYILPNQNYSYTFTKPETVTYHGKPWQRGTVIVLPTSGQILTSTGCQEYLLCTYQLQTENGTYSIHYRFNGTIEDMRLDGDLGVLNMTISPTANGTLQIAIPRALMDPKTFSGSDDQFAIFIDDTDIHYQEYPSDNQISIKLGITGIPDAYRYLVIPVEKTNNFVEIIGKFYY